MPCSLVRTVFAATLLSACTPKPTPVDTTQQPPATTASTPAGDPPAATSPTPPKEPVDPTWVDAGAGLSIRIDLPPGPYKLGDTLDVGLEFRNDGQDELRIYFVQTPIFRALQSDLALLAADGKFLDSQPEPHPHGYVVSERDFPAIPPGTTQRFTQPLHLDRERIGGATGDLQLRWTYRNAIESWAGGVQTLDGPTKSLFGGGPIPGIWLGEIKASTTFPLTR